MDVNRRRKPAAASTSSRTSFIKRRLGLPLTWLMIMLVTGSISMMGLTRPAYAEETSAPVAAATTETTTATQEAPAATAEPKTEAPVVVAPEPVVVEPKPAAAAAPVETLAVETEAPAATAEPKTEAPVVVAPEPVVVEPKPAAAAAPVETLAVEEVVVEQALVVEAAPVVQAAAGLPAVCDTNLNTGNIDTFMQRSDATEFANGELSEGLYEGGYVHQRIQLIDLNPGENELVFTYQVRENFTWAYDFIDSYSMVGGDITNINVIQGLLTEQGDKVNTVELTFTVTDTLATTESATIYFSAHIASELDHGAGTGASSINGAPYHVSLSTLNCASAGKRDNQIMAGEVQAGSVTVIKDAAPADGTDFSFTLAVSGAVDDSTTFSLDDDSDPTLSDRVTYSVAPGTITITEGQLPAGWTLENIVCTGATATRTLNYVTFTLADNQSVTCTFSNEKTTYQDLTVTKTAVPSYDKAWTWTIDKSVDETEFSVANDGTVAAIYTVITTPTMATSNYRVSGVITVTNPNESTSLNGDATVVDTIPGATCTTETIGGSPGGFEVAYTCTYPGTPAQMAGTNTATVTWPAANYYGTTGTAIATAPYNFAALTVPGSNNTVTVDDVMAGLPDLSMSWTVNAADPSTWTMTYQRDLPAVAGECLTYTNTATLSTGPSDSVTVEVCAGAPAIKLTKTASVTDTNQDGVTDAGDVITYGFVVANTGNVILTNIKVADPKLGTVTCLTNTLAVGESTTCVAATYTITKADEVAGKVYNVAVVTGTGPRDVPVTDQDDAEVPVKPTPAPRPLPTTALDGGNLAGLLGFGLILTGLVAGPGRRRRSS